MNRQQAIHNLDQDWAEAERWMQEADPRELSILTACLASDDEVALIKWMRENRVVSDCVARLALLAIHEISNRLIEAKGTP
jgi:hypothetical protein